MLILDLRGANQNNTMVDVNNLLLQVGFELIELNDFRMIGLIKIKIMKINLDRNLEDSIINFLKVSKK